MTNFKMVEEFHRAFKPYQISIPFSPQELSLCQTLVDEEASEVSEAIEDLITGTTYITSEQTLNKFRYNLTKELTDLLYVVYSAGVTFGIDLDEAFKRVHESNMSKLGEDGKPIKRADGKILKGPNYWVPDLSGL